MEDFMLMTQLKINNMKMTCLKKDFLTYINTLCQSGRTRKAKRKKHQTKLVMKPFCDALPEGLVGRLDREIERLKGIPRDQLFDHLEGQKIQVGGWWRPEKCISRHRVAIIVPYRDRTNHIGIFLAHLHSILARQQLHYQIFLVEQQQYNSTFNKGRLMNTGVMATLNTPFSSTISPLSTTPFDCYVFHDVDLLPEDDRNFYSCPPQPRHLSVAIKQMDYKLAYPELVGGVLVMRREHFTRLNGYSNIYWGWGGEDDDMAYRIEFSRLRITRPPSSIARYIMLDHPKSIPSNFPDRLKLLYSSVDRMHTDGASEIHTHTSITHIHHHPLYTHLLVDVGLPPKA